MWGVCVAREVGVCGACVWRVRDRAAAVCPCECVGMSGAVCLVKVKAGEMRVKCGHGHHGEPALEALETL